MPLQLKQVLISGALVLINLELTKWVILFYYARINFLTPAKTIDWRVTSQNPCNSNTTEYWSQLQINILLNI